MSREGGHMSTGPDEAIAPGAAGSRRLMVLLLRLSFRGLKVLQQREGLDIWYDASRSESVDRQLAEK